MREELTATKPAADEASAVTSAPLAADLLEGADEIARFLGLDRRQVYHFAERGELPVFRIGRKLFARRATLVQRIEKLEAAGQE